MTEGTPGFKLDKAAIGARIRDMRMKHGMSQEDLAEALHVARQTVSNWERGKTLIDVQSLVEISCTLEITLPELLGKSEMQRLVERDNDARHELMTIYVGLTLFVPAVIALEVIQRGTTTNLWFACTLLPPVMWLSWRAFEMERDLGLRTAHEIASYIEHGDLPKHPRRPRSFAAYIAFGAGLWIVLELILALLL